MTDCDFSVDSFQQMDRRPQSETTRHNTCVNCNVFSNERLFIFKVLAISMSVVISYESPALERPPPFLSPLSTKIHNLY
jgi:hypothetical protein